jgi:choice-of-anchor B domain-containing protein
VRNRSLSLHAGAAVLGLAGTALGQFDAQGTQLLTNIPLSGFASGPANGSDCWGYVSSSGREYALMCLSNALAVIEVTNPSAPDIIAEIPHSSSLWGDVKVYLDYAYVVNETGGGIDIVDLSNADAGQATLVQSFTGGGVSSSHNVVINEDSGYLYLAGSNLNGGRLTAFSLANPEAPVLVGSVNSIEGTYVHDAQVVSYTTGPYAGREIAYCSNGGVGLDIYDVTDKANMFRLSRTTYANLSYCHQCWASDDLQLLYVNDETDGLNRTTVFDISTLESPVQVGEYTSGLLATDHNLYVHGDFIHEADYRSGLRIFDASGDPTAPVEVAWFDSYPGSDGSGFDGAWSTYPYFPSGNLIISDIDRAFFLVRMGEQLLQISADSTPELIDPAGDSLTVTITELQPGGLVAGSPTLHYDDGSGWVTASLVDLGGDSYQANFGTTECTNQVQWYVSAEASDGFTITDPLGAPNQAYTALSAAGILVSFEDNMQVNDGWTVTNFDILDGAWDPDPSVPLGGGDRGDPPTDFDGSGACWLTDNVDGNSDVDGGPTILETRDYDMTGLADPYVSYARWFVNDGNDIDRLDVEISDDGGGSWTLVESVSNTIGWVETLVRVSDLVAPTSQVRLRFSATDNPNDSVTEAGIDRLRILEIDCGDPGNCDITNNGVTDVDDLLALLGAWGPCPGCPEDVTGDGVVNVDDLLAVLGAWGPCP